MRDGDIAGKGKIYLPSGKPILAPGEKVIKNTPGMLHRGWVRYKLGWRTIMFKGYGQFYFTNNRIIYIEVPEFIDKIHTFNIDHELGDFGGWDYHAHRMRRAAALDAFMFFELSYSEVIELKFRKELSTIFAKDKKNKYKIIIEHKIGKELEEIFVGKKY
jgi:hypothetical protein